MTSYAQTLGATQQVIRTRDMRARDTRMSSRRTSSFKEIIAPSVLFLALLGQLWLRVQIIETGYKHEAMRAEALKRDAEIRQLRLDLAFLSRPSALQPTIEKRLGLQRLSPASVRGVIYERREND